MTTLTTADNFDRPLYVFRASQKQVWIYATIGAIGVASIFFALFVGLSLPPTTPMIVALIMMIWVAHAKPVQIFDDRIEIKAAPLAPLRVVHFDDVMRLDRPKPKRARLRGRHDKRGKGVVVPLHLFSEADRDDIVELIEERIR